jgi:DNA glycosylase AlkZ-like
MVAPEAWIGRPFGTAADGLALLLRRYLAALGPATVADATAWSGVPAARLRPAIDALDRTGELWRARDERGRLLLDLVGAPRPGADVEAPPRLLPMWDGLILGHADRTRVISDEDRARVIAGNGDTYPTFLVDGRVAGLWWARVRAGEPGIELEPFGTLRPHARKALEAEGARLAAFLAGREPEVYGRYRASRDRKLAREAGTAPASDARSATTGTSD